MSDWVEVNNGKYEVKSTGFVNVPKNESIKFYEAVFRGWKKEGSPKTDIIREKQNR